MVSTYFWFDFLRGQRTVLGMPPPAHLSGRNQYAPINGSNMTHFRPAGEWKIRAAAGNRAAPKLPPNRRGAEIERLSAERYLFSPKLAALRSAGFQTCCAAGFQAGITALPPAGLETRDTADLEVCATLNRYPADGIPPPNSPQPEPNTKLHIDILRPVEYDTGT